ncbi:MAG TPA: flavin reductase family protein [Acetobacteraceae bacterium]|nr:flavin reductase family protein [Acetobacteraceae bacterium]
MSFGSTLVAETQHGNGHISVRPTILYVGTPVAPITTLNPDGTPNISPMSSAWALSDRAVLGMSCTSMGRENAVREREVVINFPSSDLWPKVEAIARATARNPVPPHKVAIGYEFEPDKFARSGFTPLASETVRPPRIAECPIQFEAQVVSVNDPGADWPDGPEGRFQIVETRVTRVHAHRALVIPGTNHIDTTKWSPLLYVFRHYFGTGLDLGRTFKAEI